VNIKITSRIEKLKRILKNRLFKEDFLNDQKKNYLSFLFYKEKVLSTSWRNQKYNGFFFF
jgi:hypothetical protein